MEFKSTFTGLIEVQSTFVHIMPSIAAIFTKCRQHFPLIISSKEIFDDLLLMKGT